MYKCWNCGTEHELPASNDAPKREWLAAHLPECNVPWIRECICTELQMAYDRGYKEAEEYFTNSCFLCGYAGEWSTWVCENCETEDEA